MPIHRHLHGHSLIPHHERQGGRQSFFKFQARASDGCRFLDRRAAIPQSVEAFELAPQTPRNVGERIQTTSESRRVHQYRGYDKAAVRRTVDILLLHRCDGIFSQKYCDVPLGLNAARSGTRVSRLPPSRSFPNRNESRHGRLRSA